MDIMLKYMKCEETRKSILTLEGELIESMQQQLKDKELDRLSALEHVAKLEVENKELSKTLLEFDQKCKNCEKENQQLRVLMEDLAKKTAIAEPIIETDNTREKELENEVNNLLKQLNTAENELKTQKKVYEEEKARMQDELFIATQKAMKLSGLEKLVEQQRNQIETLKAVQEEQKNAVNKLELYEIKIQELEKNKKALVDECKKVASQLYSEKNENKTALENAKKARQKVAQMEEDIVALEEKKKYWEQRARQAEEKLKTATEENDTLRLSTSAGNLLTQEQELKYKQKIERLEEQITLMSENSNMKLATKVSDLEGKLDATIKAKNNAEQELVLLNQQHEELQKEHRKVLEELESYKMDKSATIDLTKEYQRIKKDRDTLLEIAAKTQDISAKFEALKKNHEKLEIEHKVTQEKLEQTLKERAEFGQQAKERKETNLDLEKKVARLEEKISILQEERKKSEAFVKEVMQRSDQVRFQIRKKQEREKRITEEVKKEKERLEAAFGKKEDELRTLRLKVVNLQESEKALKAKYNKEIEVLTGQLEQEREVAKKGLAELSEMSKRQEKLFSSSIYEIEEFMNQLIIEKKGKSSTNVTQLMLSKLAEDKTPSPKKEEGPSPPAKITIKGATSKKPPPAPIVKAYSQKRLPTGKKQLLLLHILLINIIFN
eukprot:TRINITY_DN1474_c0_g1_i1.p1 TRINITY_DN1474_c0_g1~~TRINITY_DN1474_c0_g1_i1.p1  ORF type:complete len:668 (-),score=162.10 TRINITY_DN1474_c0_g1_i1:48-2051(-)